MLDALLLLCHVASAARGCYERMLTLPRARCCCYGLLAEHITLADVRALLIIVAAYFAALRATPCR